MVLLMDGGIIVKRGTESGVIAVLLAFYGIWYVFMPVAVSRQSNARP